MQNPNVVGSGYIQHAPQKPFAAPLQMQPPTVAVRSKELMCSKCEGRWLAASFMYICKFTALASEKTNHPARDHGAGALQHFEFPDEYSKYRAHTGQNGGQGPPRRAHDQRSQV